jgi:uncharacterized protein
MLLTDEMLLNYKRCSRRLFLDLNGNLQLKGPEKDFLVKLRAEKQAHTFQVLQKFNLDYQQPEERENKPEHIIKATETMMRQGVDCIYQGKLSWETTIPELDNLQVQFIISPPLLIKHNIPSHLGPWNYIAINTHLGKQAKTEYKLIAAFQAEILANIQGLMPPLAQFALRNLLLFSVNLNVWLPRMQDLVRECLTMLSSKQEPEVFISRQKCYLCSWHQSCYQIAQSQQHLSLIPGITPKRYQSLREQGINNLTSLSQVSPVELRKMIDLDVAPHLYQQAQSLVHNQPYPKSISPPQIPCNQIELYFDIEAEPERNIDYLLGVLLVDYQQQTQKYYSFLAETLAEEKKIWEQFLNLLSRYTGVPIFHYANYEVETIKRLAHLYQTSNCQLESILKRLVDVHKILIHSLFLPVENYSLKSVANWLGFRWREVNPEKKAHFKVNIGGDQCVFWYDQWLKTGERQWLNHILVYNQDDCLATYKLKNYLVQPDIKQLWEEENKLNF